MHRRQIGSVPTPWPSWMIAAHPSPERSDPVALREFLGTLTTYVRAFDSHAKRSLENVEFIKQRFGYAETDIRVRSAQVILRLCG